MKIFINLICITLFGIFLYFIYDNPLTTLTNIIAFIFGWTGWGLLYKSRKMKKRTNEPKY